MKTIHNVSASRFSVSFGDSLFHTFHVTLLRRVNNKKELILENKFSR